MILCRHCQQPIEKKVFPHAWLHTDGFLYCASKPLSTRATPPQDYQSPVQHIDADRMRGASNWDRECQESGRLNRRVL